MKRKLLSVLTILIVVSLLFTPQSATKVSSAPIGNNILSHALDIELGLVQPEKYEMPISSGALYALLQGSGELARRADEAAVMGIQSLSPQSGGQSQANTQGCQNVFKRDGKRNIRVNQDCSLRRQAEEVIAINPTNNKNLIAGMNDSRVGFNHCGYAWSFDGGKTWGDQVPPFYGLINLGGSTFDACSDPTATFDSQGNAYVGGVLFMINYADSAFAVAKSNAGIGGSFYHSPVPGPFQTYSTGPVGALVANDSDPNIFHDKEFIVADANPSSPKVDNVYATWTRFAAFTGSGVDQNSPIYFSQSTNGGANWSAGVEISGANAAVCTDFSGSANADACDQDQGSHPIVGKDGTIYVAFGNGNTPDFGFNQVLFVSCPATNDCSLASSWTTPVKVNDLIGLHPFGPGLGADPITGCPAGRQCLPPNGYRVPEFTSISISVDKNNKLYTVWSDFRNGGPCTAGPFGLPVEPCANIDNDVFYSFSTDGGATWSAAVKITPEGSAQWQPWSAVTSDGKTLWVAYYDRKYRNCEFDGCNDITLAKIKNPASNSPSVSYQRLTTSSMPNLTPANNPVQAGFLGDYMWVTVDKKGDPYVVWADTRGRNGTVEEDIYFFKGDD